MSDKLAPLIEQQGPWLLRVYSSMEDADIWAAYLKLTDESRALLRKWKSTVETLKKESNLFYCIQIWNPTDLRFLDQSPHTNPDLGEFVEEFMDGNIDELLVLDPFIKAIEDLDNMRTTCELALITVDGVTWEAQNKYSSTQYSTAQISWDDI